MQIVPFIWKYPRYFLKREIDQCILQRRSTKKLSSFTSIAGEWKKSDKLKKGVGENVAQVKTAKSNQFFRQNAHASWNAACCSLVSSNKLYNTISSDRNLLLGVIWRKKQGRKISWSVGLVKSLTISYYSKGQIIKNITIFGFKTNSWEVELCGFWFTNER